MRNSHLIVDDFGDDTGWAAFGNDTTGVIEYATPRFGSICMEFDKVDGADDDTFAGLAKTLTSLDLSKEGLRTTDRVTWLCFCSVLTNVASCFVRLGTDSSNYLEWRVADTAMIAGWTACDVAFGEAYMTGTGCQLEDIDYIACGVNFDAAGNTLANIKFDYLCLEDVTRRKS